MQLKLKFGTGKSRNRVEIKLFQRNKNLYVVGWIILWFKLTAVQNSLYCYIEKEFWWFEFNLKHNFSITQKNVVRLKYNSKYYHDTSNV